MTQIKQQELSRSLSFIHIVEWKFQSSPVGMIQTTRIHQLGTSGVRLEINAQIDNVLFYKKYRHWYVCTCWEVFIDWPVIHLQCSIATIPGKADNMILSIIYWGATLLHTDVHCANVKGYSNLALLLKERKTNKQLLHYFSIGLHRTRWFLQVFDILFEQGHVPT